MRKTFLYLAILAILGFGIYYFLFSNNDSPYSLTEAGFTVKDTASIGRIYIVASDGDAILLDRTDTGWIVNKKYRALPSTLNLLLTTLVQQTALYPVTKPAYNAVVKNMATDGIKVELYGRDGKKMKVFYVGGAAVNNSGTNMLMDGARMPYVVQVAGFTGYVTPRYSTNLKDWRDRTIFNMPPEEIKTVSVQYADKPVNSFVLINNNNNIQVDADTNISRHLDTLNTRRAHLYLKYFTDVNCEGFLNGIEGMDSTLNASHKHSFIDLTGIHGQHQHVDIYWMAINKRSKNQTESDPEIPDEYDADRLYAVINNNRDTVMIQQYAFRQIFRKAFEFYQKDNAAPMQQPNYRQPKNVMVHKNQ